MTREELEELLYRGCEGTNVVSQKCMNMKSCRSCIQEELVEYEKQIKSVTIDELYNKLLVNKNNINLANYPWNYIELVAREMTEQLKEE